MRLASTLLALMLCVSAQAQPVLAKCSNPKGFVYLLLGDQYLAVFSAKGGLVGEGQMEATEQGTIRATIAKGVVVVLSLVRKTGDEAVLDMHVIETGKPPLHFQCR